LPKRIRRKPRATFLVLARIPFDTLLAARCGSPPGTESFVRSFADVATSKAITGYRVLKHSKYIVRDALLPSAAVFTGSASYTNDTWGLQVNNLHFVESQSLAAHYARNFADLWSRG
jgi:hypothetical protein